MQYEKRDWQAQIDGLHAQQWDTFATFKFRSGRQIKQENAKRILLTTWNIVDRAYFGSCGVKRGVRVQRYGVMHMGKCGKNLHYHCVANSIGQRTFFQSLLRAVWCKTFNETGEIEECKVETVYDKRAVSVYMYHEFGKLGHATCVDDVMHRQQATDLGTFKGIRQTRRLLRLIEKHNLDDELI